MGGSSGSSCRSSKFIRRVASIPPMSTRASAIVLLGAPGAGKSVQARLLETSLGMPHLDLGTLGNKLSVSIVIHILTVVWR